MYLERRSSSKISLRPFSRFSQCRHLRQLTRASINRSWNLSETSPISSLNNNYRKSGLQHDPRKVTHPILASIFASETSFPWSPRSDMAQEQLSMNQQRTLLVIERTASVVSIVASTLVLSSFILSSRLKRRPFNRLLFMATWGNMLANVATFIGNDGIRSGIDSKQCKVQAMLIQW
jgi:hypothetical protein